MRIELIGKNNIYKVDLPKNIEGSYAIIEKDRGKEKKIVSIKARNGNWSISSNDKIKIIDSHSIKYNNNGFKINFDKSSIIKSANLQENNIYVLNIGKKDNIFVLFCYSLSNNHFRHVKFDGTEIQVGSSDKSDIVYNNPFVISKQLSLRKLHSGKWCVECNNSFFNTLVNDKSIKNNKTLLNNGDIINVLGLKIIIIGDSFYINNPGNKVSLDEKFSKAENISDNNQINNIDEIVYFSKSPRMINLIKEEKVKIDEPPQLQDNQKKPTLLLMGSSLAMGIMMMLTMVNAIHGKVNGTTGNLEFFLALITALLMFIAMIMIPFANIKYDGIIREKYEKKRKERYLEYLDRKNNIIQEIKQKQRKKLLFNNPSTKECKKIIMNNNHRLWERNIDDFDFLEIRLGIGEVSTQIEIPYSEDKFTMEDDKLLEVLHKIRENGKKVKNVPITISLMEKNVLAIISKNMKLEMNFLKNIILQMVTFHSYEELKLVFLVDQKNSSEFEYVKILPHVWDNSKQTRFWADNHNDMNDILKILSEELKIRQDSENIDGKRYTPYYLIITDNYKDLEKFGFISEFFDNDENFGFGIICLGDDLYQLPKQCKTFIALEKEKATLFENENANENKKTFMLDKLDIVDDYEFNVISRKLANLIIRTNSLGMASLPNTYSFLEMYNVEKVDKLDILERWRMNDTTISLKAPIGVDSSGIVVNLDIHEKFHGPHGLIAGSTGSGKSELIITYILSLAINYNPYDLNFLIIDYKGGGLAGVFQNEKIRLPHLVGTITNLDENALKRTLTSIQSELRRRQSIFNEVRNFSNEGTIDIYKYQKLYHDGLVKEPISHLLIICDEFAELKQQQPNFMDELISVSRIGRSLGVHLILSTQKPAGIVNDQIRSNSKFSICLKVQSTSDSSDVILKKDAAFLKNPGQFILMIGNEEYYVLGQSAWSGAPYSPSDKLKKNKSNTIEFVSNTGALLKRVDYIKEKDNNKQSEQLMTVLQYLERIAKDQKFKNKNLWLDDIPENIYINDLKKKYNKNEIGELEIPIGEYDNPFNQRQGLVTIDLEEKNNIIVFGNAESGKETLLSSIVYEIIESCTSDKVQIYILDFGSGSLKAFNNSNQVGDILFLTDVEKITRFFEMIQKEIKNRKEILSNYNGDYSAYIRKGNVMPLYVIILNNYEIFDENFHTKYDDLMQTLTREALECGMCFITTLNSPGGMRYRLKQAFNKKIALRLNGNDEYYSVFDRVIGTFPSNIFGRGMIAIREEGDNVYEFQVAKFSNAESYNDAIDMMIEKTNKRNTIVATPILALPEILKVEDVIKLADDMANVPIGMRKDNLEIYGYDFKNNFTTIIGSQNISNAIKFSDNIISEIKNIKNVRIHKIDPEIIREGKNYNLLKEFENFINTIEEEIKEDDDIFNLCIIVGIDKFITEGKVDEEKINELFSITKEGGKHSFIIIDNVSHLKEHSLDKWYKNFIDVDFGIWIGRGLCEQRLIEQNLGLFATENNCGQSFGFVIKDREPILLKMLGMKDN